MSELYRVMKKGGWGILQVPMKNSLEKTYEDFTITDPKERQKHFGQYDHVRWYGMDYFDRLKSVGFDAEANFYSQKFSEKDIKRFGLTAGLPVNLEGLVGENGKVFGLESFGFSASYKVLDEKLGFTAENVYKQVKALF